MSIIGKLHEITFYGLIITIITLAMGVINLSYFSVCFDIKEFSDIFLSYLAISSIAFLPISIICAFFTKYIDKGEGLTFKSNYLFVIMLAHIAEELLGLVLTPFWFLKDLFTKNFNVWKVVDYITYFCEMVFIAIGLFLII